MAEPRRPADVHRLLDPQEWSSQREALESLCTTRPELFVEEVRGGAPAAAEGDAFQLHMTLSRLVEWHERRLKLLRGAAIRLYVNHQRAGAG